jgi:hypothetical protein
MHERNERPPLSASFPRKRCSKVENGGSSVGRVRIGASFTRFARPGHCLRSDVPLAEIGGFGLSSSPVRRSSAYGISQRRATRQW